MTSRRARGWLHLVLACSALVALSAVLGDWGATATARRLVLAASQRGALERCPDARVAGCRADDLFVPPGRRLECEVLAELRGALARRVRAHPAALAALGAPELVPLAAPLLLSASVPVRALLVGAGPGAAGGLGALMATMGCGADGGGAAASCASAPPCRDARVVVLLVEADGAAGRATELAAEEAGWGACGVELRRGGSGADVDGEVRRAGWSPAADGPGSVALLALDGAGDGGDTLALLRSARATLAARLPRLVLLGVRARPTAPGALRDVVHALWDAHGYACYLFTPATFVPLSGAWWDDGWERRLGAARLPLVCAYAGDVAAVELLLRRHGGDGGVPAGANGRSGLPHPLPPYSVCTPRGALRSREHADAEAMRVAASVAHPPFTTLDDLLDDTFSAPLPLARGCPPPGALCSVNDVFDVVYVLSMPRRALELGRIRAQLAAAGVRYTLVQAMDKRHWADKRLRRFLLAQTQQHHYGDDAGLALIMTQRAVWAHFLRSPYKTMLMLEDDVILHRDFLAQFSARMRRIPPGWRVVYLGGDLRVSNMSDVSDKSRGEWVHGGYDSAAWLRDGFLRPRGMRGTWAVGMHRQYAYFLRTRMERVTRNGTYLGLQVPDTKPTNAALRRFAGAAFVMYPAVMLTDSRRSELGHEINLNSSVDRRFVRNGWDPAQFDVERGFYQRGIAPTDSGAADPAASGAAPKAAAPATAAGGPAAAPTPASASPTAPLALVACVFNRDNTRAAREWVAFHAAQGFSRFVFYDDGSRPPLAPATFPGYEALVTVVNSSAPWGRVRPQANWTHVHNARQAAAYRDCAGRFAGSRTLLAVVDVDEYLWSCDAAVPLAAAAAERGPGGAVRGVLSCPRFGPVADFDPQLPRVQQLTRRAPNGRLAGEDDVAAARALPDCTRLVPRGEDGLCYGYREKSVYDMRLMGPALAAQVGVHSVSERIGDRTWRRVNVSTVSIMPPSRTSGVCCNHYFATDVGEMRAKAIKNSNPFYSALADSPAVLGYYTAIQDTAAAARFAQPMRDAMQRMEQRAAAAAAVTGRQAKKG